MDDRRARSLAKRAFAFAGMSLVVLICIVATVYLLFFHRGGLF